MKYIETFREGAHISEVYLCKTKQIALTKNGKEYGSLTLQDKTGTVDAKIWELNSPGINEFAAMDYVFVDAPPLGPIIDAAVIGQFCDGALMVIESDMVSYRACQKIKTQLEKSGCKWLGVVLNKVDTKGSRYYGSRYGKYSYDKYKYESES